jgi:nucleoside-diphosphate-sugar epimerase
MGRIFEDRDIVEIQGGIVPLNVHRRSIRRRSKILKSYIRHRECLIREVRLEQSDFGKAALGLLPRVVLANGKAREELGWEPEIGLEEGVRGMMRNANF